MTNKRKRHGRSPGGASQKIDDKAQTMAPPQTLVTEELPKQKRIQHENDFA